MRLKKQMAALSLALMLPSYATSVLLTGTVVDPLGKTAIVGATVTLAKAGFSTTTAAGGSWMLSGDVNLSTGISMHRNGAASVASPHLVAQDGHLLLHYEGHDLLGHVQQGASITASQATLARSASAATDVVDTLLFAWRGVIAMRQPITSYTQYGVATVLDTSSSSSAVAGDSGTFTDKRDGQKYRYVKIGTQTWMAQNLNYDTANNTGSWCYNDSSANCATYGRLYTWTTAMGLDTSYDSKSWRGADSASHQGVCPSGWHVPTDAEWATLIAYVGSDSARIKLSEKNTWASWSSSTGDISAYQGTDAYRFTVLAAGQRESGYNYAKGPFIDRGSGALFHSASESGSAFFLARSFVGIYKNVRPYEGIRIFGYSLRCIWND